MRDSPAHEILVYIRERDVEAYIQQSWQCWRLEGHHGARRGENMKTLVLADFATKWPNLRKARTCL